MSAGSFSILAKLETEARTKKVESVIGNTCTHRAIMIYDCVTPQIWIACWLTQHFLVRLKRKLNKVVSYTGGQRFEHATTVAIRCMRLSSIRAGWKIQRLEFLASHDKLLVDELWEDVEGAFPSRSDTWLWKEAELRRKRGRSLRMAATLCYHLYYRLKSFFVRADHGTIFIPDEGGCETLPSTTIVWPSMTSHRRDECHSMNAIPWKRAWH